MKKTKIMALALSSCLILGSFAGCNKNEPSNSSESSSEAVTSSETTTTTSASSDTEKTAESSDPSASSESSEDTKATDPEESKDTKPAEPTNDEPDKITFDGDSQTYANTFMTNFVEQWFYYQEEGKFDVKNAKVEDVLHFAIMHLKLNAPKEIKGENKGECSFGTISFEKARDVIGKYMMYVLNEDDCKKLPAPPDSYGDTHPSYWGPYYEDGKVWFELGDGESYTNIAVVDYAKSEEDGNMTLVFTIYAIDFDIFNDLTIDQVKAYYKTTPAKAKDDKTLIKRGVGVANVSVGQSGKYFLNTYEVELIPGD